MILVWLLVVPLAGGVLAWIAGRWRADAARWVSLGALATDLAILLILWARGASSMVSESPGRWFSSVQTAWIPQFGITFHLALDGLSLLLTLLTVVLGMIAVLASWSELRERVGFFHFSVLWTLAGVLGVFMALDLFLFFFFWEVMLVPMYFIIALWGHENRRRAAIKFFIFTQASGLLMLIGILALAFFHEAATGVITFDFFQLRDTPLSDAAATWIMLGFFAAFAVKLPMVPLHTWLPDAHTEAPTGGSVILAGVLLKTGAYGLIRFTVPLFPFASHQFAPYAMALGVLGIVYGAVLAFAQHDFKRLVAYSSISHMGFVLVGIYAWNALALHGAVIQMLAHGLGTGALFVLAGMIQERIGSRDMRRMGGLWTDIPRVGAVALFFVVASLGLPGLGNFVGEFLILIGTFQANTVVAVFATSGLVAAAVYALILMQRTFYGQPATAGTVRRDLTAKEGCLMITAAALLVWLGLYPSGVLDTFSAVNLAGPQTAQASPGFSPTAWCCDDR